MRNGNRQYGNYDGRANRIAGGILVILISLIAFLSLVNAFGGAGRMISAFLVGVFGYVSYAYAICGIFLGIMITFGKKVTLPLNKALKYITLFSLGVMIFHTWFSKGIFLGTVSSGSLKYGQYITATYHGETAAGVFGSIVAWPFMKMFTPAYAMLFFILLFAGASILSFYPVLVNKLPYGTKKTKIKKHGKSARGADYDDVDSTVSDINPQPVGNSLYVGTYTDRSEEKSRHKKSGFSLSFPNQDKVAEREDTVTEPIAEESESERRKKAKDKLYQKKKEDKPENNGVVFGAREESIKPSFKAAPEDALNVNPLDDNGKPRSFSDRFNLPKNEQEEAEEFQKRYEYILKSDVTPDDIRGAAKRNKQKKNEPIDEPLPEQPAVEDKKSGIDSDMPYFIREILYGEPKKDEQPKPATPAPAAKPDEEDVKPSVINTDELKIIKSVNHDVPAAEPKQEEPKPADQKGSIFSIFGSAPPVRKTETPKPAPKPVEKPAQPEKKNDIAPVLDSYQYGYAPNEKIAEKPAAKPESKNDDVRLGDFSRFEQSSDAIMPTDEEIKNVNAPVQKEEKPRQPYAPREREEKPKEDNSYTNNFNIGEKAKTVNVQPKKAEPKKDERQISIDQALAEKRKRTPYIAPPIDLLKVRDTTIATEDFTEKIAKLEEVFAEFKIDAKVVGVTQGPTFSRFELEKPAGIPVTKVTNYADDIAMKLKLKGKIRFETPIPGKDAFGVEIANAVRTPVSLRSVLESSEFNTAKSLLTFGLGRDIGNTNIVCNLEEMPHMLIAGGTGSGKSVCINALLVSLLYRCSPNDLRLILIDPKMVEMTPYNGLPHLLVPEAIDDVNAAVNALDWAINEMQKRYALFKGRFRNISEYNEYAKATDGVNTIPRIVIVFDELADFMAKRRRDVDDKINALTRLARAAGIHLVVSTQRPSVDVITGTIKSNLPSRIALSLKTSADSMTILGEGGAEKLLGNGDMLYYPTSFNEPLRLQGAYVDGSEVNNIVKFIKDNNEAYFDEEAQASIFRVEKDEEEEKEIINPAQAYAHTAVGKNGETQQFIDALYMCVKEQKASISRIQRKFGVGYGTAANIVDLMEEKGYVSPNRGGNTQRDVLMTMAEFNEKYGSMREETTEFDMPEDDDGNN